MSLPQMHPPPKAWFKKSLVGVEICGVKDHGNHFSSWFLSIGQWKKNSNLIITALFHHIKGQAELQGRLPTHCYLQADNAAAEGKNRWVLAFCFLLILWGLFETVTLSFLPPGHTHEDVDQDFSTTAKPFLWDTVPTLEDFENFIHEHSSCT